MNIGIDIDDTIANTYDVLFNYAQNYTIVNKDFENENIERVYSWPHLYQKIENYKKIMK